MGPLFFNQSNARLNHVCFLALDGGVCLVYFIQHVIGLFDCLRAFWLVWEIKRKLAHPSFKSKLIHKWILNMPLRNKTIIFHTPTYLNAALLRTIEMWCVTSSKVCTCEAWFLWSFHIRKISYPRRVRYARINLLGT